MIDRDPYISIEEAERLGAGDRATIYRRIEDGDYPVRPAPEKSANGRPRSEIRLASLPEAAQLRYWQEQFTAAPGEPGAANLAEAPESARLEAMRRLRIVFEIQAVQAGQRGEKTAALQQLARQHQVGRDTLYRWMAAYDAQGFAGLVPTWGAKKGTFTRISDALQGIIRDEYLRPERPSATTVHRRVAVFCEHAKIHCPSVATLNRFLGTIPRPVVIAARLGPQAYRVHAEPKIHRDYEDLAVGEMWVGDHRELDLFVRDSDRDDAKIFRPWLTAWLDLRSRTCVGWHLGLVPNSETIALALRAGILRFGLPHRLYMDNGKDYTANFWGGKHTYSRTVDFSEDSRTVLALLNITVTHAQVRAPWAKAIEPWFGHTLPVWERTLPGWCGRDNKERPEKLAGEIKSGRLMTLDECRARITACIEAYHDREHSALEATPRSQWQGIEKRIPDARALDLILTKHKGAQVYQDGLRLFGRRYWHDALMAHLGHTVEIRYDPANIGSLIVFKDRRFLCEARNDKAFSMHLTEQEGREVNRRRKASRQAVQEYREHRAIAQDPDRAAELVVAQRRVGNGQVLTLRRPDPTPEPGGAVMPVITGFERAASERARAEAQRPRPAAPAAASRRAEADQDLHELLRQPAPRRQARTDDAERDALLREII